MVLCYTISMQPSLASCALKWKEYLCQDVNVFPSTDYYASWPYYKYFINKYYITVYLFISFYGSDLPWHFAHNTLQPLSSVCIYTYINILRQNMFASNSINSIAFCVHFVTHSYTLIHTHMYIDIGICIIYCRNWEYFILLTLTLSSLHRKF